MENDMPAGALPTESEIQVGDRVLHKGGVPAMIRQGHPEDVAARNSPKTKHEVLSELDKRVKVSNIERVTAEPPETSEEVVGDGEPVVPGEQGEGAEPGQGDATPETEGQPEQPAQTTEQPVDVRALLEERDRQHQAEMALMRDEFQRTLDAVTRVASARQGAPPAEPPEDVDPDVHPSRVYGPALQQHEARMARIEAAIEDRRVRDNVQMVDDHLRGLAEKSSVFKGRPQLTARIVEDVRGQVFGTRGVTDQNWQQHADRTFRAAEAALAAELPSAKAPKDRKAAEAARALTTPARKPVPLGAGSSTPQPGTPRPRIDFSDPDQRKAWAMPLLADIEAGRA